jgi:hypothetical protein
MKKCRTCGIEKEETDFYKTGRKNGNPEARHSECKECAKARVKKRHEDDPDRAKDRHLRRAYGISLADFNRMVLSQGSKCACCGTSEPGGKHNTWNVDHDHVTGQVRELLCKDCNIVLGLVEDSPEHLQKLIQYVLKHSPHNKSIND